MQAQDVRLTGLVDGQKQFIIPVFQRDYSWGTKHCLQLWQDIVRVGTDKNVKAHFVGSVVYVEAEETSANITRWLLIDGQQRLTTLTLLLAALRNRMKDDKSVVVADGENLPTPEAIDDSYLVNRHARGDRRFKCISVAPTTRLWSPSSSKSHCRNQFQHEWLRTSSF
jgi:uncharacterized protein with ParB-like and HNH nuclease domain